jgi:hypothetical protein
MRAAQLRYGIVINFAEVEAFDSEYIDPKNAEMGAAWNGESFTNPVPPAPIVPQTVTKRQGRQALILRGNISLVQPAIDAISNPIQKALMQSEWDDSQEYHRNRESLIMIANVIGYTTADQIDELFIFAASL